MSYSFEMEKEKVTAKLIEAGVPREQAEVVADCMVTADMYGVTSHGVNILDAHLEKIRRGGYNLNPVFKIERETTAFAVVDSDNAFGFVSADFCMKYAMGQCKSSGIFHVFSRNNNTVGPAFYYPLKAVKEGMIGILYSNSPAQMPPYGGKEKMLGTNPFAAVLPVPGQDPIIIDMATSVVAKSKFKEYKATGKKLPDGWALDENGNPTNDPDEGIRGLVLPMAGFKGYGIAMLIDILSGVLSGAAYLNKVGRFYTEDNSGMNVGVCCIAIDPKAILGDEYEVVINDYVNTLRNSDAMPGMHISIPGDDRNNYRKCEDALEKHLQSRD